MQTSGVLDGVELGQFIMKTQMGRIFRGMYAGESVTVKVGPQLTNTCLSYCLHNETFDFELQEALCKASIKGHNA